MQAIPITARQTGGANHHAIRTQQGELGATLARMPAMLSLDPAALADEPALDNPSEIFLFFFHHVLQMTRHDVLLCRPSYWTHDAG